MIGLSKGDENFGELSKLFKKLEFEIFSIDHKYTLPDNQETVPDLVMRSNKKEHGVMIYEFTKSSLDNQKQSQLRRYAEIDGDVLKNIFKIASSTDTVYDIILISIQRQMSNYINFITEESLPIICLEIDENDESCYIQLKYGEFQLDDIKDLLSDKFRFDNIGNVYIEVDIFEYSNISEEVAKTLLSFLIKHDDGFIVDRDYLSQDVIGPYWEFCSPTKKGEIGQHVLSAVREINDKCPTIKKIFERTDNNQPKWRFSFNDVSKDKLINDYHRELEEYVNSPTQQVLDFNDEQ